MGSISSCTQTVNETELDAFECTDPTLLCGKPCNISDLVIPVHSEHEEDYVELICNCGRTTDNSSCCFSPVTLCIFCAKKENKCMICRKLLT